MKLTFAWDTCGFWDALGAIKPLFVANIGAFGEWLNSKLVRNLVVREIPIGTEKLSNFVFAVQENGIQSLKYWFDELKVSPNGPQVKQIFTKNFEDQLKDGIIPSFYMHVKQKTLYFQDGTALGESPNVFLKKEELEENGVTTPYINKTPWDIINDYWNEIVKEEKQKQAIVQEEKQKQAQEII